MRKWYANLTEEQKTSVTVFGITLVIMTAVVLYIQSLPAVKAENEKNRQIYIDKHRE